MTHKKLIYIRLWVSFMNYYCMLTSGASSVAHSKKPFVEKAPEHEIGCFIDELTFNKLNEDILFYFSILKLRDYYFFLLLFV